MTFLTAIGTAISTFFAELTWASVGTFLLKTVASMGLSVLAQKLAGGDEGDRLGVKGQMERGADVPQSLIVGRYATAGSLTYANTRAGSTPNETLTMVITLSDLPVSDLVGIWVNGVKCTFGAEEATGWTPIIEFRKDGYEHLRVRFYDGTQVTADQHMVHKVSTEARPWDQTAVGFGKAYVIIEASVSQTLFRSGFPHFLFEVEGARLYDPSKDTSVGGSGSHRWASPETWEPSENAAVQIYNILRGVSYLGEFTGGAIEEDETISLSGLNTLSIRAVGGGGGASTMPDAGNATGTKGADGLPTVITLKDGGATVKTWTAAGGSGGDLYSDADGNQPLSLRFSPMTPSGDGESGGRGYPIFPVAAIIERGLMGNPGSYLEVTDYDISGLTDPTLTVQVGVGATTLYGDIPISERPGSSVAADGLVIYKAVIDEAVPQWFYGLQNVTSAQLPVAHWISQIEKCRAGIAAQDGTEPQFRASGELPVNAQIHKVIEGLLTACNGRLSDAGGVYKLFAGAPGSPVVSFTDDDIITTHDQTFTPFLGLADTVNGVSAKYPSPEAGWQVEATPPLYRPDYEAEDGGRRLLVDVSLDLVPYAEQAQRLMLAALNEARRARRHTFTLPPRFWALEPGDVVEWTSARNGYVTKQFRVDGLVDLQSADVIVDITEIDPTDYDFDTDVDFTPPTPPSTLPQAIPTQEVTGFTVQAATIQDGAGGDRRPAIWVAWDGSTADDIRAVKVQVRVKATERAIDPAQTEEVAGGSIFLSAGILPATEYEVRAQFVPASPRPTEWTAWTTVTTDDIRLVIADVGGVIWDAIDDAATDITDALIAAFDVDTVTPAVERIDSDIIRLDRGLELQEISQTSVYEAIGMINDRIIWLLSTASETTSTIRDAGVYVDPADGAVRIYAVERQAEQISETEIRLDAAEASINLRATRAYVDDRITNAVLDPSQVPIVGDLNLRISNVEVDLDAAETAITLKADQTEVTGQAARLTQAEIDIDALDGAILLKVDQADFTPLESRVGNAEVELSLLDGPAIRQTVADARSMQAEADLSAVNDLATLLNVYKNREQQRTDLAYATSEMRALVDDERIATAALLTQLGGRIDNNIALIEGESLIRVSETSANAQSINALDARLGNAEGDILGQASAFEGLETDVGELDGRVVATSQSLLTLTGRVEDAENEIGGVSADLTNNYYTKVQADSATAQASLDLKTAMEGSGGSVKAAQDTADQVSANLSNNYFTKAGTDGAIASATQDLRTTVGGHTTAINQATSSINGIEAEYTLRIDNNGIVSGMIIRSDLDDGGKPTTAVGFVADKFAITGPGGAQQTAPFIVYTSPQTIGGVTVPAGVYMKDATIRDGLITNAKIADAAIGSAKLAGVIESDNFVAGVGGAGWRIKRDGVAEFNEVTIRRQIEIASGTHEVFGGYPGYLDIAYSADYRMIFTDFVPVTGLAFSDWNAVDRTYLATVKVLTGGASSGTSGRKYGWEVNIIPMANQSGTISMELRFDLWAKVVNQITTSTLQWKIYEVS